ncbi:hypothetical protein CCACVL1_11080, partial [Corchorus capsularis]
RCLCIQHEVYFLQDESKVTINRPSSNDLRIGSHDPNRGSLAIQFHDFNDPSQFQKP